MPAEEKKPPPPKKPRRRWRRWVFGFFLLFTAFLVWANGPGLRWVLAKVINSQLEAQQLSGSFEVKGTALTGVALHEVDLSGPGLIQSVESNLLRVDWTISSLLDRELESVTLDRLHLVIDPAAAPASDDADEDDPTSEPAPLSDTLDLVRGFLQPAEISLKDLDVEVIDVTQISLSSLTHEAGTTRYVLEDFRGRDHLKRPLVNPKTTLTWTEDGFQADKIGLRPTLGIENLVFQPGRKAGLDLIVNGKTLEIRSDLQSNHRLRLASPALPFSDLIEIAGIEDLPPVSGTITALGFNTSGGLLNLEIRDFTFKDQTLAQISLQAQSPSPLAPLGEPVTLSLNLDQKLTLDGTITPNEVPLDSSADLAFEFNWPDIPPVSGEIAYDSREARLLAETLDSLRLTARYQVESQSYRAEAVADLKEASTVHPTLAGPLNFTVQAGGNLAEATHNGTLDFTELTLDQANLPNATSRGVITWDWPRSVTVPELTMTSPEGRLEARLAWQDSRLEISQLDLIDQEATLLSATASLPASLETRSLDDFLALDQPLSLKISSQPLSFQKLSSFAPLPEDLRGIVQANLSLAGTPAQPTLDGFATLDDFRLASQPDLPPLELDLNFETADQTLSLTAEAKEPGGPLLEVDGKLPFLPRAWINREADPSNAPVSLIARTPDLDLRRIKPFVPLISSIRGTLNVDLSVSGTLDAPDISGSTRVNIASMRLTKSPISDFKNTNLFASFSGDRITIQPSTINASGGNATLGGTIDLVEGKPVFDLSVQGKHFLLYRTPDFSFRGHPNLKLTGPFSGATLSGTLELVESLIYKDIEILPFGVPRTTEIPQPNLPTFAPTVEKKTSEPSPPSGVGTWKLNIAVSTRDDILVRGNLATGRITGEFKVLGTIDDPKTDGTLTAQDLVADLPFSDLEIKNAVLTLRPESLTNPGINLRGISEIGQYTIRVNVSGAVQEPRIVLSSDPPLPESEIMLLLATGSASDQLADQQVASQKALQYLFEALRRRNRDKDKSILQRLLKNSDQIELSLGETNQFSGRRFSSATLEIDEDWDFTTQIDEQGQTRALVIFSIRLK